MIDKRPDGRWRVRIYHRSRYVRSRTFARKTDAMAWERSQQTALSVNTWASPAREGVTVAEWWDHFQRARPQIKPSASARHEGLARRYLLPRFGKRPLTSIAPSEIAAWANLLQSTMSASSTRQAVGLLRQLYKLALSDGVVQRNPTEGLKLPRVRRNEPAPLTHEEVWGLVDHLDARDGVIVLVMAYGGLRWGECVALTADALRGDELRLTEAVAEVNGVIHVGDLKDHEARTVPLPRLVAKELRGWLGRRAGIVFQDAAGGYIRYSNWRRRRLDAAVTAAELGRKVTPHHFRDTAASLAIQAGASVVSVSRMLGHEDPSTTLKHYAGLFPSDLSDVAAGLDRGARAARKMPPDTPTATPVPTKYRPNLAEGSGAAALIERIDSHNA